jgi:hypothetical protein
MRPDDGRLIPRLFVLPSSFFFGKPWPSRGEQPGDGSLLVVVVILPRGLLPFLEP